MKTCDVDLTSALEHCLESPCDVHSVLEWDSMGRHTLCSGWSLLVWSGPSPVTPEARRPSREVHTRRVQADASIQ